MSHNLSVCPVCGGSEIEREECVNCGMPVSRFIEKASHGGPNRGQGRKPKPPGEKYRHRLITLPPALDDRLIKWSIESGREISPMIADLLTEYLERNISNDNR